MLMQSGLPDVSQMMNPEAMLVTTVTVACLGLAVMMLTRPRAGQLVPESVLEGENPGPAEELKAATALPVAENRPLAESEAVMQHSPAHETRAGGMAAGDAPAASGTAFDSGAPACSRPVVESPAGCRVTQTTNEMPSERQGSSAGTHGPAHGASALIAKVATLIPAGVAAPRRLKESSGKHSSVKPGARFSRSQQAFLRIPVILSGRDESGSEFREETCTLVLLPQGAVIPLRQKVQAGEKLTLSLSARQKEVECEVFCAQAGPDGRPLVEVEFLEPQKGMWPVSFPAWAGSAPRETAVSQPARSGASERTGGLDSSGS